MKLEVTKFVRPGKLAYFDFFRAGIFYYRILNEQTWYNFCIPLEDLGSATLNTEEKAITLMRWIRKSMEDGTFIKK